MRRLEKRHRKTENAYAECLDYLSGNAERHGLRSIASTLKEARKKIAALDDDAGANDNIGFPTDAV